MIKAGRLFLWSFGSKIQEGNFIDLPTDCPHREIPGWLYPVTRGATTIWETWEGYDPDGEPFASHNHYAFGAIMEWIYRYVVGIDTCADAPGYKRFVIQPNPGGGLRFAGAELETVRGRIACKWSFADERFVLEVNVPANTGAEIRLPAFVKEVVDSAGLSFFETDGLLCADTHAGEYRIICAERSK